MAQIDPHQGAERPTTSERRNRWLWPPRPFTWVVVAGMMGLAFFANFPAVNEPCVDLENGGFDPSFSITEKFVHGWPLRYASRAIEWQSGNVSRPASHPWRPWEGTERFDLVRLIVNLVIWSAAVIASGIAAQYWRSQRRALWQVGIRDLLGLTVLVGAVCAWIVGIQADARLERRVLTEYEKQSGNSIENHTLDAAVPAWLPHDVQRSYHQQMRRVRLFYSEGNSDLASQLGHVIVLQERAFHRDFRQHLRQMPRLVAIDLSHARLPYFDATRQATLLRDLPAMPNLRGINLYGTNVTDADLAWLAKCPQLEVINLSATSISDRGLRHLAELPRLRRLALGSSRVTDAGCHSLAAFPALEELELGSRNFRDAGIAELEKLPHLQLLKISAPTVSDAAWAHFRAARPDCQLRANGG